MFDFFSIFEKISKFSDFFFKIKFLHDEKIFFATFFFLSRYGCVDSIYGIDKGTRAPLSDWHSRTYRIPWILPSSDTFSREASYTGLVLASCRRKINRQSLKRSNHSMQKGFEKEQRNDTFFLFAFRFQTRPQL